MYRPARVFLVPLACAFLMGQPVRADDSGPPTAAQIEELVRTLNADQFSDRQRAERDLLELGPAVLPALKIAVRSPERELRTRAERISLTIRHRILRQEFQRLAGKADADLDVEEAMWLISTVLDPTVKREDLARQLDRLAERVRLRMKVEPARANPREFMEALQQVLFVEEKFTGNVADYANPENSSLAHVLASRRGLPILLSHVVIAVGRRLHVPVVGVAATGRYLVKYAGEEAPPGFPRDDIYLDPFAGGRFLSADEVKEVLEHNTPERLALGGTSRAIVQRMLTNFVAHLNEQGRVNEMELVDGYRQMFRDEWTDELDP